MQQNVSILTIITMAISALVAILLPIALVIIVRKRQGAKVKPALVGAITFIVSSLIVNVTVSSLLLSVPAIRGFVLSGAVTYSLFVGLSAGIFEETGRFISFKILRKKYDSLPNALSYGIGHGGIESILLVGLTYIANIVFAILINTMGMDALNNLILMPANSPTNNFAETMGFLYSTTPSYFLLGGIERISAIITHISLSVMVWQAATKRAPIWMFPLAIALHALFNVPAGLFQFGVMTNIWLLEGIVMVFALAIAFFSYKLYSYFNKLVRPDIAEN